MLRWRKRIRKISYIMVDVICVLSAFLLAEFTFQLTTGTELPLSGFERISFLMLYTMTLIMSYLAFSVYERTIEKSGNIVLKTGLIMLVSLGITEIVIGALLFFMKVPLSRMFLLEFLAYVLVFTFVNRLVFKFFCDAEKTSKNARNIVVVGHSRRGISYIEEIKKHKYLNFNILGYVSIKESVSYDGLEVIGGLGDLTKLAVDYVIDEIAVARPLSYDPRLSDMLRVCQDMGITVTMLLETQNKDAHAQVAMVGDLPVLKFHTVSLNESQIFMKRILDVLGGSLGILLFAMAYIIIGPLIKLETPGPVIFKQDRVGKNGRIFKVWKFRSMGVNAEKEKAALMANNEMSGHMFKMSNDPRITKIGGFIRKTSIDELPQFWNVLRGDMSLVGTRPPTVKEVKEYETHHRRRISIIPGITGNWQVSGRSEIEDFNEVLRLDEEYISGWTIWRDVKILFKTVLVVLKRDGSK